MLRRFVEVKIRTTIDSGELLALLDCGEILGSWEEDGFIHIYWAEEKWKPAVFEEVKQALGRLCVEHGSAEIMINTLYDRDWNAVWASSISPIRIGRRVQIRQSWNSSDLTFEDIELVIDPKQAFGTGYHVTTQLMIECLEKYISGGERVLDIGTGSGILAMVALRLGAASALGIDTDAVALECARENLTVNGFGPELELRVGSWEDIGNDRFDVILANLHREILLQLCSTFSRLLNEDGIVLLSGLQSEDFEDIAEILSAEKGKILVRREREGWLALEVAGDS